MLWNVPALSHVIVTNGMHTHAFHTYKQLINVFVHQPLDRHWTSLISVLSFCSRKMRTASMRVSGLPHCTETQHSSTKWQVRSWRRKVLDNTKQHSLSLSLSFSLSLSLSLLHSFLHCLSRSLSLSIYISLSIYLSLSRALSISLSLYIYIYIYIHRQTDRQTDRQMNTYIDRFIDRYIDRYGYILFKNIYSWCWTYG